MDFAVIKDGDSNRPEASRDLCIGIAATALVGLIGFIQSVDWPTKIKAGAIAPFVWVGVQAVLFVSCIGLVFYWWFQIRTIQRSSAYKMLMERLVKQFSGNNRTDFQEPDVKS
jgi:phosphotransferase system  glucose/maltose/N-acetylglucosamine-specific IIC component